MKKFLFSLTIVLILPLLSGCASLMQTAKLQEVIRKPKNYCQLVEPEKAEIALEDMPVYDESGCYPLAANYSLKFSRPIAGEKNQYYGEVLTPWSTKEGIIIMPYPIKLKPGYGIGDYISTFMRDIPEDICILQVDSGGITTGTSFEKYKGKWEYVTRVIKKRKWTPKERQIFLKKAQQQIEEKYEADKQNNTTAYTSCNSDYDRIVEFWQASNSIRSFCNSVEATWFSRKCTASDEDEETCKTLKNLFVDCYYQGAIRADKGYVHVTFFGNR